MNELLAVMSVTLLAVISPGGDFAMVTRNSYLYGKRMGMMTALGIASACWVHIAYTLLGIGFLLKSEAWLFNGIKILGALYLIYLGCQTTQQQVVLQDSPQSTQQTLKESWKNGFFTNALNPKTTLFVLTLFTQVVSEQTPLWVQLGYGLFISLAHLIWFCLVAQFLSTPALRNRLLAKQKIVNTVIGGILILLGLMLLLGNM